MGAPPAVKDVLKHQLALLKAFSFYVYLVAGLGAGKTRGLVMKALQLGCINAPLEGVFVEPDYPMIRQVAIPSFREVLTDWGAWEDCTLDKRNHELTVRLNQREFLIRFRNSKNPTQGAGMNLAWAVLDEADAHREELAVKQLIARIRHPDARLLQFVAGGTPEGANSWLHRYAELEPLPDTTLIRALTTDNKYLKPSPEEYIRRNLGHLSEVEIDRYVRGLFVSRRGRVYTQASDDNFTTCLDPMTGDQLMTCDFTNSCMAWVLARRIDDDVHVHGEIVHEDTDTVDMIRFAIAAWRERFALWWGRDWSDPELHPDHEVANKVTVFGDSSAQATSDVRLLRQAGFHVLVRKANPLVRHRVNSMQVKLNNKTLLIDDDEAPYTAKCIRSQGRNRQGEPEKGRAEDGKAALDHGADALGYLISYWWKVEAPGGNITRHYH